MTFILNSRPGLVPYNQLEDSGLSLRPETDEKFLSNWGQTQNTIGSFPSLSKNRNLLIRKNMREEIETQTTVPKTIFETKVLVEKIVEWVACMVPKTARSSPEHCWVWTKHKSSRGQTSGMYKVACTILALTRLNKETPQHG